MFFYSNPDDADISGRLPDAEVFHSDEAVGREEGWYFWFCFPGCIPDSDEPWGPYSSQDEAIRVCREMVNE